MLKPLIGVSGTPLIERVIARARSAGDGALCVASGYCSDGLRMARDEYSARENVAITQIVNCLWDRAIGIDEDSLRAIDVIAPKVPAGELVRVSIMGLRT